MAIDRIVAFGDFRIDPQKRQLTARGVPIDLKPRVFEALLLFVESDGRLLTKEELIASLWPDVVVEENNLTQCISALRKALGDGHGGQRFIVTESRRGYRWVADTRFADANGGLQTSVGQASAQTTVSHGSEQTTIGDGGPAGQGDPDSGVVATRKLAFVERRTRRLVIGAALCIAVAAVIAIAMASRPEPRASVSGAITSLAVLPFKQLEPAGAPADLGLTLADAVIARLTALQVVAVRPTAAVRHLAGTDWDPIRAAHDLDVDAVVEGAYRLQNGVLRLTLRVIIRKTGDHMAWWESFERDWNPTLEDTLAEHATGELVRGLKSLKIGTPSAAVAAPRAAGLGVRPAVPFTILVADDQAFGGGGGIIQIDPATGAQTALASGGVFVNPTGIAVGPAGDLFVADADALDGTGAVIRLRFDTHTGSWTQTVVSKSGVFRDPVAVTVDRDGTLLVVDTDGAYNNLGRVVKVDPDDGVQTVVSEGQYFHEPRDIAIERDGQYIVTDAVSMMGGASQVIRVDPRQPSEANQTVISSGGQMEDPSSVVFDAVGRLFVTDWNTVGQPNSPGHVFQIDVATGAQRKIASGGLLQQPTSIRVAPTGDFFVSDWQTAAVVRVDPITGAQTAVSAGGMLVTPRSMAILVERAGKRP